MIPFPTTRAQQDSVEAIFDAMHNAGVDSAFAMAACGLAMFDQVIYNLLEIWMDGSDRAEVEADIQASVTDYVRAAAFARVRSDRTAGAGWQAPSKDAVRSDFEASCRLAGVPFATVQAVLADGEAVLKVRAPAAVKRRRRALHARLVGEGRHLKDWFLEQVQAYLNPRHEMLPSSDTPPTTTPPDRLVIPDPKVLRAAEPAGTRYTAGKRRATTTAKSDRRRSRA